MRELSRGNSPPVAGLGSIVVTLAAIYAVVQLHHQQTAFMLELARLGAETLRAILGV